MFFPPAHACKSVAALPVRTLCPSSVPFSHCLLLLFALLRLLASRALRVTFLLTPVTSHAVF